MLDIVLILNKTVNVVPLTMTCGQRCAANNDMRSTLCR